MLRIVFSSVIGCLWLALSVSAFAQETNDPVAETAPAATDSESTEQIPPAEPAPPAAEEPADPQVPEQETADQDARDQKALDREAAEAEARRAANVQAARDLSADPTAEPIPLSTPESVATSVSPEAPTDNVTASAEATEESEEQRQARLKDLLSLVTDNTPGIHKRENPAYFALVNEVLSHTPEELRSKARKNPRFDEFYRKPAKHRGELVHLMLNVRRVLPIDVQAKNEAGVTRLYELWGWTDEAKAWMYCCITPELPDGFPTQGDIAKRVELTGYFFKMQAYQPGDAEPNARNLVAPLIIGYVTPAPHAPKEVESVGSWPFYLIGGFGLIMLMRILMHVRFFSRHLPTHRNYRRRPLEPLDADTLTDSLSSDRGLPIRNADE